MAQIKVRYLTMQPGADGQLPRYFWQPSSAMRALGWRPQRVPLNWAEHTDPAQLQAAAVARVQELNAELDASRIGQALAATRPAPVNPSRTLGDLIKLYRMSKKWTSLAPATHRGYLQCLKRIEAWGEDVPVRAIGAKQVQVLKNSMDATPTFANAVVRVLRLVLEHGRREGWIAVNPAQRPDLNGTAPSGIIWPREAVAAFVQAADAMGRHSIGTAVMLNEWAGQREGDILRITRKAFRSNGDLLVRQTKTGAGVRLPLDMVPALAARLAEELARLDKRPSIPLHLIINETTGSPYKKDAFRHIFAAIRAKAADSAPSFETDNLLPGRDSAAANAFTIQMTDLTFMRLRHTAVTRLGEVGCNTGQISAITGHSQSTVQQLMNRYMVSTGEMARQAFQKRLDGEKQA